MAREVGRTVEELGRTMGSAELTEWLALLTLEARESREAQDRAELGRGAAVAGDEMRRALRGK